MLAALGVGGLLGVDTVGASSDSAEEATGSPGAEPATRDHVGRHRSAARSDDDDLTRFTLLHTNDEHSHLVPFPRSHHDPEAGGPALGGFARLAGTVREIRREREAAGEDVLLLSAGDIFAGPPFGWLPMAGLAPELRLLQDLGYDAVVVGNHEFDYGPETLAQYCAVGGYPEAHATTPLLGANVHPPADHDLHDVGLHESVTLELRDDTQVGVGGLIGEDAVRVAPKTDPVEFSDPVETARRLVDDLRADGADVVVLLTHAGVDEDRPLAREVDGVDLIVGGHSHTSLHRPLVEGDTHVVQAGANLRYLGVLELGYRPATGEVTLLSDPDETDLLVPLDEHAPVAAETRETVDAYAEELDAYLAEVTGGAFTRADAPVMRSDVAVSREPPQQETPLGNFVTDAIRLETAAVLGERVDVAFQADGLIRADLTPGTVAWSEGQVVLYDLLTTSAIGVGRDDRPGYPVVSFWVTEEEVIRSLELSVLLSELLGEAYFLQVSGARVEYDPDRALWGTVPFVDTPLPAYRATLSAERYTGDGVQDANEEDDPYEPIGDGDRLVRVATDYHVGLQIPSVGEIVPRLAVQPKDRHGEPIDLDDAIVHLDDGTELKVWDAVVRHATNQPTDADGTPRLASTYHGPDGRLREADGRPLVLKPLAGAAAVAGAIGYGVHRWRRR